MIYFAFVHISQLLYGIEVNANTTPNHLTKLITLNNKLLRVLQRKPTRSHTVKLYKIYYTLLVQLLHNFQILTFMYKYEITKTIKSNLLASTKYERKSRWKAKSSPNENNNYKLRLLAGLKGRETALTWSTKKKKIQHAALRDTMQNNGKFKYYNNQKNAVY